MTEDSAGAARRRAAQGHRADDLQELLASLDPQLAHWADEFIFGEVWGRPGLEHEERMLVAITALATRGETDLLINYLHGALQSGVPPRKIHEALVMLVVYAGFPPAVRALHTWRKAFDSTVAHSVVSADGLGSEAFEKVPRRHDG